MRGRLAVALLLAAVACGAGTVDHHELDELRARAAAHGRAVDDVSASAARLSSAWADVVGAYQAARVDYEAARATFESATRTADNASETFKKAAATWERARLTWELYQRLVVVAAAIDAANFGASRSGAASRQFSCERVSTAEFRRMLEAAGQSLVGMDIDHIVPRSLGGADHPSNYQVLPSSLNRSLGNAWGPEKCRLAGARCADAVAVSRSCGEFRGVLPF